MALQLAGHGGPGHVEVRPPSILGLAHGHPEVDMTVVRPLP